MKIDPSLLDFQNFNNPSANPIVIDDLLNLDIKQFKNRSDLIDFLANNYIVHDHTINKIILFDYSNYCYKIGLSSGLRDNMIKEMKIYEEAKKIGVEMFFEPLEYIGPLQSSPRNGLYRQKKLIVYKKIDYSSVLKNWIDLYGIQKVNDFNSFLDQKGIAELNPANIGYDPDLNTYKLIDYERSMSGIKDGQKKVFNSALGNYLEEV